MKLQTKNDAECVMAHGTPSVNNRRHYLRFGAVFYPLASVVWMLETGEWPKSTPRHLDGDPSNNDFGNLRKPGRAVKPRKPKMVEVKFTGVGIGGTDADHVAAAQRNADAVDRQVIDSLHISPSLFR